MQSCFVRTCAVSVVSLCLAAALPFSATAQELNGGDPDSVGAPGGPLVTPAAGEPDHERLAPRVSALLLDRGIELDGRLDEAAWSRATPVTRFLQREPEEGLPATQRTEVRFAHDGVTLYIGARMYDDRGADGVVSRLVRRDADPQSDQLTISLDPFLDHRGSVSFSINPAGVRGDAAGHDDSWDPVWRARTAIDEEGWTAEVAIPFSQLRFPRNADQDWGLQIERRVNRLNEVSVWSFWRLNQGGGPSRFGHLDGMSGIEARANRLELLPYVVSQLDVNGTNHPRDPFTGDTESNYRLGADLKYLLTSNLTVSATVNPDFGQAEVDPAVVNLSAFETVVPEKREFFIAGRDKVSFGNFWCQFCSNVSSLSMLFTRRIGRRPGAAFLASGAGEFSDVPDASTILGAAKVTGRTQSGTSIGVLAAATQRERGRVVGSGGERFEQEVEPFTTYGVARVKQDFKDGDLQIGGIVTSVARNFSDPALESLMNRHSEGVGVDAEYWWGDRTYHWLFSSAVTNIAGSPEAILRAQRSSARYFQRPDREHGSNGLFSDRFDPDLTSMRGWGVYSRLAKDAGDWRWEAAINARSPGFENNDIAFLTRADYVWMNANLIRQWTVPGSWYRNLWTTVGVQQQYNFDGDLTDRQVHAFFGWQTPFYWNINTFGIFRPRTYDDRMTRGGPVVRRPRIGFLQTTIQTDQRRSVIASLNPSYGWNEEGGNELGLGATVTFKPASNVSVSLNPSFRRSRQVAQYVTAVDDPTATDFFGKRYIFAGLSQRSFSMTTRVNWTFTPTMSLEAFIQPLISANDFREFKEFAAPRQLDKLVFGRDIGTVRAEGEAGSETFFIDPDGGGPAEEFSIANPDFNFRSLRGNLVFRWEYMPGSTLFFVWTQDRSSSDPFGDFDFGRDADGLFGAPTDNIFLLKLTYWLGI
ncbi:MAG: DUF5916 domain-containing protein [Gemmatimonadota bacterium]|nr:DUF5916 domain-containing protein [Gemmatimonadota bacterium]